MQTKRIAALQDAMGQAGIDLAVFGCGPSYQYLTGTETEWRFRADMVSPSELLLVPRASAPEDTVLIAGGADLSDALGEVSGRAGTRTTGSSTVVRGRGSGQTIAVGDQPKPAAWSALLQAFPDATFVDGDPLVAPLRLIKDADEIAVLRKAATVTDEAVRLALPAVREGISMRELQLEIEMHGRRQGATGTSFDIVAGFIQAGTGGTGSIFSQGPDEGLKSNTTIFLDIGFVVDGYCSDWGRTIYFGTPNNNLQSAYAALQTAVAETVEAIEVGKTRVCDLYPMFEARLDRDGYGDFLRARLPSKNVGHQIGIVVHELPWLEPRNSDTIVPGMIFCIEPKLWDDGEYYMRVEDMVLITADGAEFLTTFDRELFAL